MTIKDFAKLRGVSCQSVYQKLKKAGLDVSTLKDRETGQLTEDGQAQLENLYSSERQEKKADQSTVLVLQAENQLLLNQIELLRDQVEHLRRLLDQEQRLHFEALQRIPEVKKPWFKRLSQPKKVD